MSDQIGQWGRISTREQHFHRLIYGNAGHGVHGWALDAFQKAERVVAEGKGLPASRDIFRMTPETIGASGSRLGLLDAWRFASKIWAIAILRAPTTSMDFPVLLSDPRSIFRGKPVVLGERPDGAVYGLRLHDALDGTVLAHAAQREGLADIDALLRRRAEQRAAVFAPFAASESREQALARVDLQRAIEAAERSETIDWLLQGPRLIDASKREDIDTKRLEEVRKAIRGGDIPAPPPKPELRDPADEIIGKPPAPEAPPKSEDLLAVERLDERKREIERLAADLDRLAAARGAS